MRTIFLILLLSVLPVAAQTATYYVRTDGNDRNSGRENSPEGAWRSIDRGQPTVLARAMAPGDTTIYVAKASQFPPAGKVLVGKTEVSYTGGTPQSLTGCRGVTAANANTVVSCLDAPSPQPGDVVIVGPGVYCQDIEDGEMLSVPNVPMAVASIRKGGTEGNPITFKGQGIPVVDGKDNMISWAVTAPYIHIEGFDVRRGGVWFFTAKGGAMRRCRVHEGNRAVHFAYSNNSEIAHNLIYDFQGAWTGHGITVGSSKNVDVHHNTIVSNAWGISVYAGTNVNIHHNLISWCRTGIRLSKEHPAKNCRIYDNNVWWCKGGIWLQRDDNAGKNFYENVLPEPKDSHLDPLIASWNPKHPDFLRLERTSPLVNDGEALVGRRRKPAAWPDAGNLPEENLVFNPSFEAGLLGWYLSSWEDFLPGQAEYKIVEELGSEGQKCLYVFESPPEGKRINVRIRSLNFRYTRGKPLTISFRAKADRDKAEIIVGINVPSWQDKSGLGKRISLSTEWKTYSHTLTPLTRFPDMAAASFTTYQGRYWLDAIKVEEGETATKFSPAVEFIPDDTIGMLVRPGKPLKGRILNHTGREIDCNFVWSLHAPFKGNIAKHHRRLKLRPRTTPLAIRPPSALSGGILALHYRFEDDSGRLLARGKLRFSIGKAPRVGRNHHFFSATPEYWGNWPGEIFNRKAKAAAALGLGTFHVYLGYERINEMLWNGRFSGLLYGTEKAGLAWLFTPSDAKALTGKQTWAPGPDNAGPDAIEVKREDLTGGRCTDAQLRAWSEAIFTLARKYRGRIRFWEVLNEPNTFLSGEEYAKVLSVTSRAVRSADPRAHIIGGSVVNAHRKDLYNATMHMPAGSFDSFSFHPYRFGLRNPESERESYRKLIHMAKEDLAGGSHPVKLFLTEEGMGPGLDETRCIGYRLSYSGVVRQVDFGEGEILHAQYAARMFLTALGEGGVGYSYHTLYNLTHDSLMNPLLALKAIHTMDTVLGDAEPIGKIPAGPDYVCYLFHTGPNRLFSSGRRDVVAAVWPKDAEYALPIRVEFKSRKIFAAVDLLGLPRRIDRRPDSGCSVMLGRELIYLVFRRASADEVRRELHEVFSGLRSVPGGGLGGCE